MRICLALRAKIEASSAADPRTLTCKEVGKQYTTTHKGFCRGNGIFPRVPSDALNAHVERSRLQLTSNAHVESSPCGPTSKARLPRVLASRAYLEGSPCGPTSRAGVVGSSLWGLVLVRSLVSIWFYISNKCVEKNNYNKC